MKFRKTYKRKQAAVLLSVFLLVTSVAGCQRVGAVKETGEEKVNVVTTIFPQYDFVRQIAGDNVEVSMLLKPGEETHSYEPTPQDILKIQNCDLFIYVGGENDEWVEDILDSIDTEHIRLLRLIDCVDTVNEEHVEGMKEERGHEHGEEKHGHEHGEDEEEGHETLTPDEHVWTSPENAIAIVEELAETLEELDPEQKMIYEANKTEYIALLEGLDDEFKEVVDSSKRNMLLFGDRFPFRYFAEAYGLEYYAAFPGCASDTEPSAATMAFLIKKVEQEHIPVVLKMELSNENIANAIAETTHAKVKTFYSCHNLTAKEFADGETYLSMMKKNVETLKEALN
ncbi:metal ABC transporter substrate-binding protein [Mediterraneibacter gnavus]|uniref:metal ABC transporter substrate-binding protein n=1 Tax=Mediterraneibacter gnavus TaxID=33038 RepID=UPI003563F75D